LSSLSINIAQERLHAHKHARRTARRRLLQLRCGLGFESETLTGYSPRWLDIG
jgi:hypothetical protein